MKRLLRMANAMLAPFGARIVDASKAMTGEQALRRLASSLPDTNTIIDIGCAEGTWSQLALSLFPEAQVIGLEPLREREAKLKALEEANERFQYSLVAAGELDDGMGQLRVSEDLDGSTMSTQLAETTSGVRPVPVSTLDRIVVQRDLSGPFIVKFDTHGYEQRILKGMQATLRQTTAILMEVYNYRISDEALRFHETCALMEELGFRCTDIADPLLRPYDNTLWQMDFVFVRKELTREDHNGYR